MPRVTAITPNAPNPMTLGAPHNLGRGLVHLPPITIGIRVHCACVGRMTALQLLFVLGNLGLVAPLAGVRFRHGKLLVIIAMTGGTGHLGGRMLTGLPIIDDCRCDPGMAAYA